jgi:hypothetical protein
VNVIEDQHDLLIGQAIHKRLGFFVVVPRGAFVRLLPQRAREGQMRRRVRVWHFLICTAGRRQAEGGQK